ncbi:hypothetical protein DPMN_194358 [Dreissena polymorpha]|uniref:Uncharacterized protein n=1 Tax=Dreissena polymorpha TaxID=45954 RepID=A0A9D3Y608_DREPO|nr:hypothetical protein DPMN_194358 [Dreissena polymorpha]
MKQEDIIGTNLLTKFHEDRKINVASRVLTWKNAPPPGSHFHEDRTVPVNVTSRVLTRFYYSHIRKNAPPLGSNFFQANIIIFELIQDIIEINLLTKFHDDRKINVASRVLTRKIASPPWWPYIIGMNLLTEFHEDRTINVASRVKNAPPLGSHVFQANVTIFELIQDIIKKNLLTIFHQDWAINVASRVLTRKNVLPPGSHMNLLTKFHEDWTINVASRVKNAPPFGSHVFQANFYEDQTITVASRVKDAPPLGSHVFQANITIFELIQDINETNLLTKFYEDLTINVASRELTRQMLTPHNGRRTKSNHISSP